MKWFKHSFTDSGVHAWRRRFLALTLGGLTATSSLLNAQDFDDEPEEIVELEAFVVQGIRASQTAAVEIKRASTDMVDAIVTEDIGKFPDNNVIEALQRVPGVQTTDRSRGEVSNVTIRGFTDVTTTVNGRSVFTGVGRSVALQDIPASLLNRVDIYKTRSANLIESGIAGVIDIKTQRPFYFPEGERTVIAARGIYSEMVDKLDPNVSGLYTKTWEFDDGSKFGLLVNLSYSVTNWTDKSATAGAMFPYFTENVPGGLPFAPFQIIPNSDPAVAEASIWTAGTLFGLPFDEGSTLTMTSTETGETYQVPYYLSRDAVFSADFYGKRKRPAANVSLQYAPNDDATYTFEVFYNGYREDWENNLIFYNTDRYVAGGAGPGPNSTVSLIPGTNIIGSRTNGTNWMFMSGDKTDQKTDSILYAIGGEWRIGDNLTLTADVSHQKSTFETKFLAIQTNEAPWITGYPPYHVDIQFDSGNGVPAWQVYDDPSTPEIDEGDLTNAQLWNMGPFYDNGGKDVGEANEFVLHGTYRPETLEFVEKIQFGLRLDSRDARQSSYSRDEPTVGFRTGTWWLDGAVGPENASLTLYPELQKINTGWYDGKADIPQAAVLVDADYLLSNADDVRSLYNYPTADKIEMRKNFDITEKTVSTYLQSEFRYQIGTQVLTAQAGVRYVMVGRDLNFWEYTGMDPNEDGVVDDIAVLNSSATTSADKFLPSAALIYDVNDSVRLRASYGQTLRYPGYGDLNPNLNLVPSPSGVSYGSGSGGNPDLKPTESKNYDLAVEYYFGANKSNVLYATWFKREIEGLVVTVNRRITDAHPTTGLPYDYVVSTPFNASNGTLDGMEFGLVWFPDNLPDFLDGFGIQASYTMLDSEQDLPNVDAEGNITGYTTGPFFAVSDSSYSVVLAYEKPKYSARLSYVWREDFLHSNDGTLFASPLRIYRDAQKSLDFQFTYNITRNWALTFDATNLTGEEFHSYYIYPETHNFGNWLITRTFAVGTRFSF